MPTQLRSDVPIVDLDPFSIDVLASPGKIDDALRDAGPVCYLPALDVYAVARHDEVYAVLRDWQHFESAPGVGLSNFRRVRKWRATSAVLEADPPLHDAPRRVLASVLGPAANRAMRQRWQDIADQLVGALVPDGRPVIIDGVADLAAALPLQVVPDAIGIPAQGRENLVPFSDFLLNAFGPRNDLVRKGQTKGGPLSAWVDTQCRRDVYRAGSWGAAIWEASDRGDITPEQAPLVLRSLFAAGVNTTVHALAALLLGLATNPEQWATLRREPQYRVPALDEAIRWHSPIQTMFRTTRGNPRVGAVKLPDNAKVLLCIGAANRDPRKWERPEMFDVTRGPSGHVGFGAGIHQCVGQNLARLEAESLLGALAERVEHLEVAAEPTRRLNNSLNSWAAMPLRLHPA